MGRKKSNRGGYREGAGRPATSDRKYPISVRVSKKALEKLSEVGNKSECIDELILQNL